MLDDLGHIAWGLFAVFCILHLPWWLACPLIFVPREVEQTALAMHRRGLGGVEGFLRFISWNWAKGKVRDLAGFALGGLVAEMVLR